MISCFPMGWLLTKRSAGVEKNNLEPLGYALGRLVAVCSQCVSARCACNTHTVEIQLESAKRKVGVLKRGVRFLRMDLLIQELAGEPLRRSNRREEARTRHEESLLIAGQLADSCEYAQAL